MIGRSCYRRFVSLCHRQSNQEVTKFGEKLSRQAGQGSNEQQVYFGGPSPSIRLVYEYYVNRCVSVSVLQQRGWLASLFLKAPVHGQALSCDSGTKFGCYQSRQIFFLCVYFTIGRCLVADENSAC